MLEFQGYGTHINEQDFDFCKASNDLLLGLFRRAESAIKKKVSGCNSDKNSFW